ncbi:LADA_0E04720g1_1 [Lachancea dasiensis]|uniref:LADA_0E04720g1_1 n=1 Tax=Lachancea dasiensis TaxID=1072105 RepID=A0A1G4JCE7_9SACH|nr:LADA_0E04720g1_1 [Lachancea dasiensis]
MQVGTPITSTKLKQVHSPPSVGSSSPSSTRAFKKLSGPVMTRVNSKFRSFSASSVLSPSRNQRQASEHDLLVHGVGDRDVNDHDNLDFGPTLISMTKPITNIGTRRNNAPAPLSFTHLTPRPTPRKSGSSGKNAPTLESPMEFRRSNYSTSDCGSWVTASSVDPRKRLGSAFQVDVGTPRSNFAVERPSFRDPFASLYPDTESPTYAVELRRNVSNAGGPKNFISNNCNICKESLCCALKGEKLMELTCGHQCHYNCYLVSFEALFLSHTPFRCSICKQAAKPKDEDMFSEITARILCGGIETNPYGLYQALSPDTAILPQAVECPVEETSLHRSKVQDFRTPNDQVIRSSEVTSNGFRQQFRFDSSFGNLPLPSVSSQGSSYESGSFASCSEVPNEEFDFSRPRIHVVPQLSKFTIRDDAENVAVQYAMTAYLPKLPKAADSAKGLGKAESRIRKEIEMFFKESLNCAGPTGTLEIFDVLRYSEDEDVWLTVIVFLFQERLLFASEGSIVRDISKEQISELHQLDPYTIILDLKSKSLPEVFLGCGEEPAVIRKWFHCLKRIYLSKEMQYIPLEQLTVNSWDLLPQDIAQSLRPKKIGSFSSKCDNVRSSVFTCHTKFPLKIVLCFSIINCHPELHTNDDCSNIIKSKVRQLLDSLSDQDFIGLVVVGKDGSGQIGAYGTFIGMVNKSWYGLDEFLESLEVHNNDGIFLNDTWELALALETCRKLICTVEGDENYLQQLILLGNDYPMDMQSSVDNDFHTKRLKRDINLIVKDFKFSIYQYFTCNCKIALGAFVNDRCYYVKSKALKYMKDAHLKDLIHSLHEPAIKSLALTLSSVNNAVAQFSAAEKDGHLLGLASAQTELDLDLGTLRQGEVKTVLFEVRLNVANLRHFLGNSSPSQNTASSTSPLLQYHSQWYDGSGHLVSQGFAFGCDFRFGPSSTTAPPVYSLKLPSDTSANERQENGLEELNISLAPPLSASRDMFFATRQMELTVVETLNRALNEPNLDIVSALNHLISMVFCISRDCVCNDSSFYRYVNANPIGQYAEKLSSKLQYIADMSCSEDRQIRALSRWNMCALRTHLAYQDNAV